MASGGQFQNLTSGQGHVVTQVGHVAYESMRIDDTDTVVGAFRTSLSKGSLMNNDIFVIKNDLP